MIILSISVEFLNILRKGSINNSVTTIIKLFFPKFKMIRDPTSENRVGSRSNLN